MAERFHTPEDAAGRFIDTICMYEGIPYSVTVDDRIRKDEVFLIPLGESYTQGFYANYTSDLFDYGSPDLGYFNDTGFTYYLRRAPLRTNVVGLRSGMLVGATLSSRQFFSARMRDCILGTHPSFEEALGQVRSAYILGRAFHRHLALKKDSKGKIVCYFMDRELGYISDTNQIVVTSCPDKLFVDKISKFTGVQLCC